MYWSGREGLSEVQVWDGHSDMTALTSRAIGQVPLVRWVELDGTDTGMYWQGVDAVLPLPRGAPQLHWGRGRLAVAS